MKKIITGFITVFVLTLGLPITLRADVQVSKKNIIEVSNGGAEKAKVLLSRIYEIEGMNKSSLASADKAVLRREVKSIQGQLKTLDGGVYLSVGAIIIIAVLLILLL
jgi:hypothetical protein